MPSHAIRRFVFVVVAITIALSLMLPARAADGTNYGAVRDFLVARTNVVELTGENGERIAICPELQGRIMTSTASDLEGRSFGWVNKAALEREDKDKRYQNVGGEDRFWLGPEGGPFGLWFASPTDQKASNWTTPAALNEGVFKIASGKEDPYYRLTRSIQFQNASKTQFHLEVSREIHMQKAHHFGKLFGGEAQSALQSSKLKIVGFQTINTIANRGPAMQRDKGLVSIASAGQFPGGPRSYVILPYKDTPDVDIVPVVNYDYFPNFPTDRLRVNSQAAYFLGDGKQRAKIGIPQARARAVAGVIDLQQGFLTLIHYSMPSDPTAYSYVDNHWGKQEEPFRGDVVNCYNDGPNDSGRAGGGYYEIETFSPAAQLPTGKSITHTHSTFHIEGDTAALARVAKAALGVEVRVEEVASENSRR